MLFDPNGICWQLALTLVLSNIGPGFNSKSSRSVRNLTLTLSLDWSLLSLWNTPTSGLFLFWLIPAPAPEANFLNWSWLPKRRGGELGGVRELDRLEYPLSPSLSEIFLIKKDILNDAYILFLPDPDSSMIVFRLDSFMRRLNLSLLMTFFLLPARILPFRLSPPDMIDGRKDAVVVEDCWLCCA